MKCLQKSLALGFILVCFPLGVLAQNAPPATAARRSSRAATSRQPPAVALRGRCQDQKHRQLRLRAALSTP